MSRALQVVLLVAFGIGVYVWGNGVAGTKQDIRGAADRVVYGNPAGQVIETHSIGAAVGENGRVVVTGAELRWEASEVAQTKTQVYDGQGIVSGRVALLNQDVGHFISGATKEIYIIAGEIQCGIEEIGPQDPDDITCYRVWLLVGYADPVGPILQEETVHIKADTPTPWNISRDYSISVTGNRLWREESTAASGGRSGHPVYSKEVRHDDEWKGIVPFSWDASFGTLASSGTQAEYEFPPPDYTPEISPITDVGVYFSMHKGSDETQYGEVTVNWAGHPIDFSGGYKDFGSIYRIVGVDDALECWVPGTGGVGDANHTVSVTRPLIVDFSEFYIRDRLGNLVGDNAIRINGPFVATPRHAASLSTWSANPDGTGTPAAGDKCYPTPALLRAVGTFIEGPSRITGLDYADPDMQRELVTTNVMQFTLTPESLRIAT